MATVSEALAIAFAHHQAGRLAEAEEICRGIIAGDAGCSGAWHLLGGVAHASGKNDEAAHYIAHAVQLKPNSAEAHYDLGVVTYEQGKHQDAIDCFRRAIELKPDYAAAHYSLGFALDEQGKLSQAIEYYNHALEFDADHADAHWNRSLLLLLKGDFEQGWREYEWCWKTGRRERRVFSQPHWEGEALNGQTILIHAEQGLGDTIQLIRYALLLKSRGATVIVECQRSLLKLLASCSGIDRLLGRGDELPAFDFHCHFLSLPRILGTTRETIPAKVPYLFANEALIAKWRMRLEDVRGIRVGINWHGREGNTVVSRRDIPLEQFAALAQLRGVQFISLQKGARLEELADLREQVPIVDLGEDVDTIHGAFMDTAAIMMNLDLVITSDTSVPHLAGALGVPVWTALPFVPDWRWLLDREDSPWYPTMRLFRQKKLGEWDSVFEEMSRALKDLVARPRAAGGRK